MVRELAVGGADRVVDAAAEAHHVGPHGRVPEQRGDVRPERHPVEVVEVLRGRLPVLHLLEQRQDGVAGDGLDAAELIGEVLGRAHGERQAAAAHEHGGDAVADRLAERRVDLDLGVVVGVQVDEARDDPPTGGVDDLGALGGR